MGMKYSIRRKLTIALVIILLSFLTMNAINYYHSIDTLTRKLTDGRLKVLNETAQSVRQLFSGIEARASEIRFNVSVQKVLSADFSISGYEGYTASIQAQKVLQSMTFSWDPIKSIYIVPKQVLVRNKSTTSGFLNQDSASIPPLYQELDGLCTESGWFPTRMSEGQDEKAENIYTYVQPVTNLYDSKAVMGHILMNLKETSLYQILRNNTMDDDSRILLLDEKRQVFYDSSREYQTPLLLGNIPDGLRMEGTSGSYLAGKGNQKLLVTYTTIPETEWKLISFVPYSQLSGELESYQTTMNWVILICAAVSAVGIFILYQGISRPIRAITKRIEKISTGDFSWRADGEKGDPSSRNELELVGAKIDKMAGEISELIERNSQILAQKKDAELKALQAQINPHFLYNTLDSINWLALLNHQPEISFMVTNLSKFYKNGLNSGREIITIEEEIAHARAFLEIEKYSYPDRFDMDFNLDPRLLQLYSIKLILQPLVENAVLHAFEDSTEKGQISIHLYSLENAVCLEVIDNGKGMTPEQLERVVTQKSAGYGIANVDERIKLRFGENYGVFLQSELGNGTVAQIRIPPIANSDVKPAERRDNAGGESNIQAANC